MALRGNVFVFIGTYPTVEAAESDYEIVRELRAAHAIGTYDASIVSKDAEGKVKVTKVEMAARHAGWGGAAAGALVGLLFPPAILGTALVGAAVGAAGGHLWKGMSRSDVKDLGELIDTGDVALVVVGTNALEQTLDTRRFGADRHIVRNVELTGDELDDVLRMAMAEVTQTEGPAPQG